MNLHFHPSVYVNLLAFFQSVQPHLINDDSLDVAQLSGDLSEELWAHDNMWPYVVSEVVQ